MTPILRPTPHPHHPPAHRSYLDTQLWDVIEHPPQGLQLDFVKVREGGRRRPRVHVPARGLGTRSVRQEGAGLSLLQLKAHGGRQ